MIPLAIFPTPVDLICTLHHDIAGWTLTSHTGVHPLNGAPCQLFDLPSTTPDGNGATLTTPGRKGDVSYHGVLYLRLPTGPGLMIDVFPPVAAGTVLPRLVANGQFLQQSDQP